MFFDRNRSALFESAEEVLASSDNFDPNESDTVKSVVDDLNDTFENIEEVPEEEKESTGATELLKPSTESVILYESSSGKMFLNINDIMRINEAEDEEAEETGDTEESSDPAETAEEIADNNNVDKDDLVVVAPADTAIDMVNGGVNEAVATGEPGKHYSRMIRLANTISRLQEAGFAVARISK